jgi:chromosome segregation ATPase
MSQERAVAIAFGIVAVCSAVGPPLKNALVWWRDFRLEADAKRARAKLDNDTAEMDVYSNRIADANAAKGEYKGENEYLKKRVADLEAKVSAQADQLVSQAEEIRENRHAVKNVEQTQKAQGEVAIRAAKTANMAGNAAIKAREKAENQEERLAAVEHLVASTSGVDFPAATPVEPPKE